MINKSTKRIKKGVLVFASMIIGVFASFFFPQAGGNVANVASADVTPGDAPCPDGGGCCDNAKGDDD